MKTFEFYQSKDGNYYIAKFDKNGKKIGEDMVSNFKLTIEIPTIQKNGCKSFSLNVWPNSAKGRKLNNDFVRKLAFG